MPYHSSGSYYGRGDYYRGDYYRGDPGLFKFIGSVAKKAAGVLGKVVGLSPAGTIAKTGIGIVAGAIGSGGFRPPTSPGMSIIPFAPPDVPKSMPGSVPQPGFRGAVERFLPGGESGYQGAPAGYHVNKAYKRYLIAKAMGKDVQDPFSEPRARNAIVRNRRMNIANGRALSHAIRRAQGFARYARRVLSFVEARAPKGRARFKKKR